RGWTVREIPRRCLVEAGESNSVSEVEELDRKSTEAMTINKAFKEHQQRQFESDEEEHEVDGDCEADFTDLHSVPPPKMIMPGTGYVYCLPISNDHWAA
ncbi:hypothetical protein KUCAC02_002099, partial [Chaenocephalus aceratus]